MGIVAFLPRQAWLDNSRLAPVFLTAAHGGSHVVPFDLGERIRQGLQTLRIVPSSRIHFATAMRPILAQGCETNTNPAVERVGKGKRFL
jgi:hypothetical protein